MEKFFTTEGAVKPDIHYCLDPLRRINIGELETLINAQKYFVLHSPRQTGKTTSLLALRLCGVRDVRDYRIVFSNQDSSGT